MNTDLMFTKVEYLEGNAFTEAQDLELYCLLKHNIVAFRCTCSKPISAKRIDVLNNKHVLCEDCGNMYDYHRGFARKIN
jgi:hypothetical protein